MSETGAVEACPSAELTPLVDLAAVWMENKKYSVFNQRLQKITGQY